MLEKFYCNRCGDLTARLHPKEHWADGLLMVCRACATESIDPPVRELTGPDPDDARRRQEHEIAEWELQRRRALETERSRIQARLDMHKRLHETARDARGSSGDMAL